MKVLRLAFKLKTKTYKEIYIFLAIVSLCIVNSKNMQHLHDFLQARLICM